jgi:hypothetical protein
MRSPDAAVSTAAVGVAFSTTPVSASTRQAVAGLLAVIPGLSADVQRAMLAALDQPGDGLRAPTDRILSYRHAAELLSRSHRTLKTYTRCGLLPRVVLPGRQRAAGVRLTDIEKLIAGK